MRVSLTIKFEISVSLTNDWCTVTMSLDKIKLPNNFNLGIVNDFFNDTTRDLAVANVTQIFPLLDTDFE